MLFRLKEILHIYNDEAVKGLVTGVGKTTPADGTSGYVPGAIFHNTTDGHVYRNDGTLASCDFVSISLIDGDDVTIQDIATSSLKNVTGADTDVVTGTAGTDGNAAKWNADGDLVDGKALPTGDIVGTSDTQTLTGKTLTSPKINEDVALTATATQLNAKVAVTTAVHSLGTPVLADVDLIVTSEDMKVGAYTIDAQPDVPRNLTVTHTTDGVEATADTLGTIDIVGTDYDDNEITETITPVAASTVEGTKAFKTVTSVTGVDWVIGDTADTITVGVGDELGLPVALSSADNMISAWADSAFVTVDGSVGDPVTLEETTIDMSSATYDGSKEMRVLVSG